MRLFMGTREYNHGIPQLVQIQTESSLAATSHAYILKVHMNECELLNNAMHTSNQQGQYN